MTRELERFFNEKIAGYQIDNKDVNGIIAEDASRLVRKFLKYTRAYPIDSVEDVPDEFDPIIK